MQPTKCATWSPRGLDRFKSFLPKFFTPNLGFHTLGTLVGFKPFVDLFVVEAFHEDLGVVFSFLILINPQVAFAMFLLCYAQCFNYLLHMMFPSPCILQHCVEFDTHTITMLEKLFVCGILWWFYWSPSSSRHSSYFFEQVWLPLCSQIVALAFLGCWALIVLTLVIHFQQDDHPIFLNVVTHVKSGISSFQMALQDIQAMLPQVVSFYVPLFESPMV